MSYNLKSRKDLILKIISLYPDTFRADRPEHVQSWVEMYEKAIRKNWDMEKLMYFFATQYKSTVVPPPPSFFFEYRECVKPMTSYEKIEPPTEEELEERKLAKEKCSKIIEELKMKLSMPDV